ncbi:MAG TPA: glycosyltransferase family 2 protein [Acidimicrobiales bacterium]|nr:glycosyltransferase family 2 protein [Acidimicrobiales bacterium]
MDLTIIMPAYNEEATILEAVQTAVDAVIPVKEREILVVENGSQDSTRQLLRSHEWPADVRIIEIDVNRGKGGAIKEAIQQATGKYVAILDADMEYDPNDYGRMYEALEANDADAVYGTRLWQAHTAYSFWYVMGNRAVNVAANVIYNVWLSDCMVGMKLVKTDLFRDLALRENGFGFDAEVTARLLRRGTRIYEVPVKYRARKREEGKKLTAVDGLRMLRVFLRCRFT